MRSVLTRAAVALAAAAAMVNPAARAGSIPLGTAFTYQGRLDNAGVPANGEHDFAFLLWDSLNGGGPVSPQIGAPKVPVTDGLFTVQIDFGSALFDSSARFLEIEVNGVTLSPRQPITASPYALQTRGIFVDNLGRVGLGTTSPLNQLHVRGEQATLRLEANDNPFSFTEVKDAQATQLRINKVNAGGLVLLDLNPKPVDGASNASVRLFRETNTTGAKSLQLHRGNNTSQLSASIGVDGGDSFFQAHGGNLGIGTTTPTNTLSVNGIADFGRVAINTTPSEDAQLRVVASDPFEAGIHVFGVTHGLMAQTSNSGGGGAAIIGNCQTILGFDFLADGFGNDYGSTSSIRWKRNVELIDDPLSKIGELRGVYFDWDAEHGGHHEVGMIAEEVGAVLPEIVSYEENGIDATGMDYSKLTPLLVEAVKALRAEKNAEIQELRAETDAEIGALRAGTDAEIASLRKEIADLKALVHQRTSSRKGGSSQ